MTLKTCLRCDWEGETKNPTCPNCGVPLYAIGASPSVGTVMPVGGNPEEGSREAANTTSMTPYRTRSHQSNPLPSPADAVESSSRSAPSTVAFVLAGLALTVALGIWLKARESPAGDGTPTPTQTARRPGVAAPEVQDLTDRNTRDKTPSAPAPDVPYLIDLQTRDMTPLPEAITGSLATGRINYSTGSLATGRINFVRFAASPDGSSLAFVGEGLDGSPQIFIAAIDGSGLRQVTHEPISAITPAWSPDDTRIAYLGYGSVDAPNIFVLELATGQSKQVTDESSISPYGLQFTPDGSSIVFTGERRVGAELRTVPVRGGKSTLLFDPQARGFGGTGEGSLSPDGSLVTFMGHRTGGPGALRFVTDADGTDGRYIGSCISNPAGTWSPEGSRIVCGPNGPPPGIRVIDTPTGHTTSVAKGQVAIWLDDHTLLVDGLK